MLGRARYRKFKTECEAKYDKNTEMWTLIHTPTRLSQMFSAKGDVDFEHYFHKLYKMVKAFEGVTRK